MPDTPALFKADTATLTFARPAGRKMMVTCGSVVEAGPAGASSSRFHDIAASERTELDLRGEAPQTNLAPLWFCDATACTSGAAQRMT
jgi:hypothetical protein